jgi:hypothetical protein
MFYTTKTIIKGGTKMKGELIINEESGRVKLLLSGDSINTIVTIHREGHLERVELKRLGGSAYIDAVKIDHKKTGIIVELSNDIKEAILTRIASQSLLDKHADTIIKAMIKAEAERVEAGMSLKITG